MSTVTLLIILMLIMMVTSIVIYLRIVAITQQAGEKFNILKFRLMFPYLAKYRKLYAEGKAGRVNLFACWVILMNVLLLCFIIYLAMGR